MADLTAIIPTHGHQALLSSVLAGLAGQSAPPAEIIVVDNASPDDSANMARSFGARVIEMGANAGFCRAVNKGIQAARTPYVAILNNDILMSPHWLERLVDAIETSGAWFAVGKIFRYDQSGILDGTFDMVSRGACAWRGGEGRRDEPLWNLPAEIYFPPFTAAVFRTRLFTEVGLLDERFESYFEDVDFGIRCALAGCTGRYVPDAAIRHIGSATLGTWDSRKVRLMARNQLLLVAKHYPKRWWRHLGWPVLVGQLLWGGVAMRHGSALAYLRGKLDALQLFGSWRSTAQPSRGAIRDILCSSEGQLRQLQSAAGYDRYWRWYFRLT